MGTYPSGWGTRRGESGVAASRGRARAQKTAWRRLQEQGIVPTTQEYSYVRWLDPHLTAGQTISLQDLAGIERKAGAQASYKQAVRTAGLKARGVAGEITTQYSIHRGMPQVLADLLEESKEPGAPSGISIGKVVGIGAVGYGIWVLLS